MQLVVGKEWNGEGEDQVGAGQVQDKHAGDIFQLLTEQKNAKDEDVAGEAEHEDGDVDGADDGAKVWYFAEIRRPIIVEVHVFTAHGQVSGVSTVAEGSGAFRDTHDAERPFLLKLHISKIQ